MSFTWKFFLAPVDWQARQTSFAPQEPKKAPSVKATNAKFPSASQMRPQTAAPTMREKAEADAEWQKYKFQRQILGVSNDVLLSKFSSVFFKILLFHHSMNDKARWKNG